MQNTGVKPAQGQKVADSDNKPYKCLECGKSYNYQCRLKRHEPVHTRERNFKCQHCSRHFFHTGTLKNHEKVHARLAERHQQVQGKLYQCKECDKCFTNSGNLKRHSKTHAKKKSLQCKEEEKRSLVGQVNRKRLNRMQNTRIKLTHGQKIANSDNKPYKCKDCGKSYNYPSELKRHELVHTKQPNFKCQHCSRCFFHTGTLKQHEKVHVHAGERHQQEQDKPYQCEECDKCFTLSENLKCHSKIHAKKKSFQCKEEEKRPLVGQVNRMQNTGIKPTQGQKVVDSDNKPYKCLECGKSYNYQCRLKRHEPVHTRERNFKCQHCSRHFFHTGTLKNHEKVHARLAERHQQVQGKLYQCKECDKCFTNSGNLKRHSKTHAKKKSLQCKEEEKRSLVGQVNRKRLNRMQNTRIKLTHGQKIANSDNKPYKCKDCGKSYNYPSELKRHELVHTKQPNFKCQHCSRCFFHTGTLKQHEKVHVHAGERHQQEQDKPYQCEECDKCFTLSENLKCHSKIHAKKKSFQCKEEEKRPLVGQVNRMQNTGIKPTQGQKVVDSDNKPYKCLECGKSYNYQCRLKRHEPVHTRERNFKCQHCSRRFFHTGTLKNHEKVHAHAGVRYQQEQERALPLEAQMPCQLKNYTCWICSHEFHCETESVIRKHYDEHLKLLGNVK